MVRAEKKAILTHGPIGRQLFRLALPMLVGILAMLGFNMVDTMFVGWLGTLPLAAMTVTFPIVMVFMSVSLGLSVSTSIAVSHALGRGSPEEARRLTTDALGLGCILAVVMSGLGLLVLDAVLHALEGDLPTHADARAYMCVWLPGLLFVIAPMIGSMAIRATGDTVTPSAIIILGVAVVYLLRRRGDPCRGLWPDRDLLASVGHGYLYRSEQRGRELGSRAVRRGPNGIVRSAVWDGAVPRTAADRARGGRLV